MTPTKSYCCTVPLRAVSAALIAALCLLLLPAPRLCHAGEEPPADAAAEKVALQDLQALLERMGADSAAQPHERVQVLQALARVREALDSWPAALSYYDGLLAGRPIHALGDLVYSGAWRARAARDGNLAGLRVFFGKQAPDDASPPEELTRPGRQLQVQLERIAARFDALAKFAPNIRPLQGVNADKDEGKAFWKVMPPSWVNPRPPPKPAPNQVVVSQPATGLRLSGNLTIVPVMPNTGARIRFVPEVTPVQPDMRKRISLLPEEVKK